MRRGLGSIMAREAASLRLRLLTGIAQSIVGLAMLSPTPGQAEDIPVPGGWPHNCPGLYGPNVCFKPTPLAACKAWDDLHSFNLVGIIKENGSYKCELYSSSVSWRDYTFTRLFCAPGYRRENDEYCVKVEASDDYDQPSSDCNSVGDPGQATVGNPVQILTGAKVQNEATS